MPLVTDLAIRFADGNDEVLQAVATSKLPKLEHLTLWLGGNEHGLVDEMYPPAEVDSHSAALLIRVGDGMQFQAQAFDQRC